MLTYHKSVHSQTLKGLENAYKVWPDGREVALLTLVYNLALHGASSASFSYYSEEISSSNS